MYFIPVWDVVVLFHLTLGLCVLFFLFHQFHQAVSWSWESTSVLEEQRLPLVWKGEVLKYQTGEVCIEFVNIGRQEMMPLTSR